MLNRFGLPTLRNLTDSDGAAALREIVVLVHLAWTYCGLTWGSEPNF